MKPTVANADDEWRLRFLLGQIESGLREALVLAHSDSQWIVSQVLARWQEVKKLEEAYRKQTMP